MPNKNNSKELEDIAEKINKYRDGFGQLTHILDDISQNFIPKSEVEEIIKEIEKLEDDNGNTVLYGEWIKRDYIINLIKNKT